MVDCWLWDGPRDKDGYGSRGVRVNGKVVTARAHRLVYEALVGLVGPGLELDHLCKNPGCVNPRHLEPVTREENRRRGTGTQTHCKRGHEFTEANTYLYGLPPRNPARYCRKCHNMRQLERTHAND